MVDLGSVTQYLPSSQGIVYFGKSAFSIISIIIIAVIFLILFGLLAYFLIQRMKYNKKIIIFEKIAGRWEQTGTDKALELKYGIAGDTIFYLRKRKKYLPRPELQTGRRTYWYGIREDGEWINITLEDIDLAMKQAKAKFLHPEMRYARTALLRNLKDRYDKPKFMEKYGVILINIAAFCVIGLFMYLIIDKVVAAGNNLNTMTIAAKEVMEKANQVLSRVDSVCSGSGIKV